ncbi:MAG: preprotein translocase subunit SecE [Syntrophobacter sp.]
MNLPKLFQKKNEAKSGKVQSIDTAKKAGARTGTIKTVAKPKKPDIARKTVKKPGEPSAPKVWMNTARAYLREVVYELRKVVWPSRKETMGSTAVVLVIVGLSAAFLGVIDFFLSRIVRVFVG